MSKLTLNLDFVELCVACRTGDIDTVDVMISKGVNVNQMDEWNYSPLILASLCGHEEIVRILLDRGSARCDRDTFEGQRCIYGALTDEIRNILLGFDITKTSNLSNQPFASYISSLLKNLNKTCDVQFSLPNDFNASFQLHKFLLSSRSQYFAHKLSSVWKDSTRLHLPIDMDGAIFEFIVNYIYLVPCFNTYEQIDSVLLRKFAMQLGLSDIVAYIDEIDKVPIKNGVLLTKCKNQIQASIEDSARKDMVRLVNSIFNSALKTVDISAEQKLQLFNSDIYADVLLYIDTGDEKIYYPCHRLILCKSQYFETLFNSSFYENHIYNEILTREELVDRNKLLKSPENIPCIELLSTTTEELTQIVLTYLYLDQVEVPLDLAIDVLIIADLLLIERLKTTALITLTKLTNFEEISIYDILRTGWQTRMHRLEAFAAKIFAENLDSYINLPEFEDIVAESAERIEMRQETDSIELIDDIRFYLAKKYAIDPTDEDDYERLFIVEYEKDLAKIDDLLDRLQLDA